MSKIEKLLDKTRRTEDTKKWRVYVFAVVGVLVIAGVFYGGLVLVSPIIDTYIHDTKQIVASYDFLDLNQNCDGKKVYFVGSSIVGCDIDSDEINRILQENEKNITVYNLGIDADNPLVRSLQIQHIISSHPDLVIFGETYNRIATVELIEEHVFLIKSRIELPESAYYLFSDEELQEIKTLPTVFDNKRFLRSALLHKITSQSSKTDVSSTTDLYTVTFGKEWRYNEENNPDFDYQGIINEANRGTWSPEITTSMTNGKQALLFNVKTLNDAGIPVVIINMPLHPLISERVTSESRQNTFDFLNTTGAKWYDYEYALPDNANWYKDGHHLAPVTGAKAFAPYMADLIIQEMT